MMQQEKDRILDLLIMARLEAMSVYLPESRSQKSEVPAEGSPGRSPVLGG